MYRKTTEFCMLIVHFVSSMKIFVNSKSFVVESSGPYIASFSINQDTFTTSFPIHILFVCFSCLITIANTLSTTLSKGPKNGHP